MKVLDTNQSKRVELILQQLDCLPTLSAVALRLFEMATAEDTSVNQIIDLISADPSLASKVLKLSQRQARGHGVRVINLEHAVKLLGFEAMRNAALTVQMFAVFDQGPSPGGEPANAKPIFDRQMFWHHSLAVALVSEMIARAPQLRSRIEKGEAFLAGLLHDLGQLALHVVLPRSFDKVCQVAEAHSVSLDQACRQIIGIDSHTAGKRLAEHWQLPYSIADVMWLHGQPLGSLPDLPHATLITAVSLADAIVRRQHLAIVGHGPRDEQIAQTCQMLGLDLASIDAFMPQLHEEVTARAEALGIGATTSAELLMRSVSRANDVLGRMNTALRQRAALSDRQSRSLQAIAQFHEAVLPGSAVSHVLGHVVTSATELFGGGFFAVLYQARLEDPWQLFQFAGDGRMLRNQLIEPPAGSTAVADLADETQLSMQVMAMLPWLSDYLGDASDLRNVRLLPLRCGWGVSAVLLHDCQIDGRTERQQLDAMGRTWAAAIAAAAQHEGSRRLGERLAEVNRTLTETQQTLARSQTMAALGEIAAGAAHEMNNPLTVVSGRSQLLASRLKDPELKVMAQQIVDQSHRLSDMISALRSFAEPADPKRQIVDLPRLLSRVVADVRVKYEKPERIQTISAGAMPPVLIDARQMAQAIAELIKNALEAKGSLHIEVRVQIEPLDDRLKIMVLDDGSGLSEHALSHAFDPFFSEKPAGRQPGLGLARARRIVEAHGGRLTLENRPGGGAVATISLSEWRGAEMERRVAG